MADTPTSGLDATLPVVVPKKSNVVDVNLLQNMQNMIDERSGVNPQQLIFSGPSYNTVMNSLKDVAAWASGGEKGPSAALAARDREKALEAKELFDMRTQVAAAKAAQEKQKRAMEFLGVGAMPGAAAAPGAEGTPTPTAPLAQPRFEQMLAGLPAATQNLARLAIGEGDVDTFKTIVQEGLKNRPDMQKNYEYAQTLPPDQREIYLRTIQKEGYAPQSYVGADGQTYPFTPKGAMPKEAGTTPPAAAGAPAQAPSAPAATPQYTDFDVNKTYGTPSKLLDNLKVVESGNDPYVINKSTKALGAYQFMPETASMLHRQGMKFNAFDEKEARAAADYYISQLAKQNGGDYNKAMAQYGGFITKDPTEYVGKVMKGVDVKQQPVATTTPTITEPAGVTAPPVRKSLEQTAAEKAGDIRRREKMAEADVDTTKAIIDIGRNAGEKSVRLADASRIVNDESMKPMFGVLERGGVLGPITKFVAGGIQMGTLGSLKFGEMEGALRNAGATETQIANVHRIEQVLKQQELEYAKTYLKGQGAVSDNERNIVQQAIGSIKQPAEQLRLMINVMQERAAFDAKMYKEFNDYRKAIKDPYASFEKFTVDSPAADRLIAEHNQGLARILKVDAGGFSDPFNKDIAARQDKKTGTGVVYRKVGE